MYNLLLFISLNILLVSCSSRSQEIENTVRPNIIFVVADDMGPWTMSINNDLNTFTPELDKIGRSGAVLNNCFASSAVCSPARASLMTSRYASETCVIDYIPKGDSNGVDLSLKFFPELFQDAGYTTVMVGKWHLGDKLSEYLPTQRGYDRFTGFTHGGFRSMSPNIQVEGKWEVAEGAYTPDLLVDHAMSYLREFNPLKTKKPLLMSLHFWAPHANTDFPEGMKPTYKGRSWLPMKDEDLARWENADIVLPEPEFPNLDIPLSMRMAREYYSSVHSLDRNVGRLMNLLEELNLDDNTIVIVTSDHGYNLGHHGLWHKGNGRWLTKDGMDPSGVYGDARPNLYDNSIRVPCIIRWPDKIAENTRIDETVSFPDFFPTLLGMAGLNKTDDVLFRGESFLPLLRKEKVAWNNDLYAEYIDLRTYRTREWKVVIDFSGHKRNEFYDIKNDPKEHNNLYHSNSPDVVMNREKLTKKLFEKMREIDDPLLAKHSNIL